MCLACNNRAKKFSIVPPTFLLYPWLGPNNDNNILTKFMEYYCLMLFCLFGMAVSDEKSYLVIDTTIVHTCTQWVCAGKCRSKNYL